MLKDACRGLFERRGGEKPAQAEEGLVGYRGPRTVHKFERESERERETEIELELESELESEFELESAFEFPLTRRAERGSTVVDDVLQGGLEFKQGSCFRPNQQPWGRHT